MKIRPTTRIVVVLYTVSFFLHFVWEMWQIPFYTDLLTANHWSAVIRCSQATFGDGAIALMAYAVATVTVKNVNWLRSPTRLPTIVYLACGILITVIFEYLAVDVFDRWQYSDLMPRLPLIGTGLAPLLQWIVIPPLALWVSKIFLNGLHTN